MVKYVDHQINFVLVLISQKVNIVKDIYRNREFVYGEMMAPNVHQDKVALN